MTGLGPRLANRASRFGVEQGRQLTAVGDLRRSRTNRAAAAYTSINPLSGSGMFQEADISERLAMATADHEATYKQQPLWGARKMLAIVALRGPNSGKMRGSATPTQLRGATAAVLHYSAVPRAAATIATSRLKIPRLEYFDGFGIVTTEPRTQGALASFADLSEILGFGLKIRESLRSTQLEFLGLTARLVAVGGVCQAHLSLPPYRVQMLPFGISKKVKQKEAFLA